MITRTAFQLTNSLGWPIRGDVRTVPGATPRGLVIVAHGFKGFKDWGHFPQVCERLAEAGFLAVNFNFSGSGIGNNPMEFTDLEKFRGNTLSLEIEDLQRVIDYSLALKAAGELNTAALIGHSRGAISVLHAAATRKDIACAVCWAGVGVLAERYPASVRADWRRKGVLEVVNSRTGQVLEIATGALDDLEAHFEDYDPVLLARKLKVPILLVHGTADTSVPLSEAETVASASSLVRLVSIEGADHTFGAVQPFRGTTPHVEEAMTVTLDFLRGASTG